MRLTIKTIYLFTLGVALPLLLVEYVKPGTVSSLFGAHWLFAPLLLAPFAHEVKS